MGENLAKTKMSLEDLNYKIDWEGGVSDAMEYGIHSTDIEDEELAALWYEAEQQFTIFDALVRQIESYIDKHRQRGQ